MATCVGLALLGLVKVFRTLRGFHSSGNIEERSVVQQRKALEKELESRREQLQAAVSQNPLFREVRSPSLVSVLPVCWGHPYSRLQVPCSTVAPASHLHGNLH
jgi:hypothetical protein